MPDSSWEDELLNRLVGYVEVAAMNFFGDDDAFNAFQAKAVTEPALSLWTALTRPWRCQQRFLRTTRVAGTHWCL